MKRYIKQKTETIVTRVREAVGLKIGRATLAMLLAMAFVVLGAGEGKTDESLPLEWHAHVRSLRAAGLDVKVMKSKNMKPEKSPEEFLKRYKKIREQAGKNFTFQTFVEDVARGLIIEQRYDEFKGIRYIVKKNLNPNYEGNIELNYEGSIVLTFNCSKFCITLELLKKVFGKEDGIKTFPYDKSEYYRYRLMGTNFEVDFIPGLNKKCVGKARFDSTFFQKMENR